MRHLVVAAALAALASAGLAQPAASGALAPAVKNDVQCIVLFLVAAGSATDEDVKRGASAGVMYYLGKLRIEAPTLALAPAVQGEAEAFQNNPQAEAIGKACDSELQARGSELMNLGDELDKEGHSSSSS